MSVESYNIDPQKITGKYNGYSYQFLYVEQISRKLVYQITAPGNMVKIAKLDPVDVDLLISDIQLFWNTHLK